MEFLERIVCELSLPLLRYAREFLIRSKRENVYDTSFQEEERKKKAEAEKKRQEEEKRKREVRVHCDTICGYR
jgi:ribosomal protein L9